MSEWNRACVHAPRAEVAHHCMQENLGELSVKKATSRGRGVGKG